MNDSGFFIDPPGVTVPVVVGHGSKRTESDYVRLNNLHAVPFGESVLIARFEVVVSSAPASGA